MTVRADLRVEGEDGVVEGAWGAGDNAAVPDLSGGGVGGFCVPNAQHAVRQAKQLVKNLLAARYGQGKVEEYKHDSLGAVAGLGLYKGVGNPMGIKLKGVFAWAAHRGYHGYAMPTLERKLRVVGGWANEFVFGRDIAEVRNLDTPRKAFFEAAGGNKKKAATKS